MIANDENTTDSASEDTTHVPGYDYPVMCVVNARCLEDEHTPGHVCMCNDGYDETNGECMFMSTLTIATTATSVTTTSTVNRTTAKAISGKVLCYFIHSTIGIQSHPIPVACTF